MPKADRELYIELIELLDEAKAPGEGDLVGRLNPGLYGFREASIGCETGSCFSCQKVCSWQS